MGADNGSNRYICADLRHLRSSFYKAMNHPDIDTTILAVALDRWQKVVMVIVKTAKLCGDHLPPDNEGYQLIAGRIRALVHDGRLLAQGNISEWRHSEVRLPTSKTSC